MSESRIKIISVYAIIVGIQFLFCVAAWFELMSWVIATPVMLVSAIALWDQSQKKHTVKRNFPVIGNFRYILEAIIPEIMQYFIESDIDVAPIN